MDIQWIIEQNMQAFTNGTSCACAATEAILTALSMGELDTIKSYQRAKDAILITMNAYPKESAVFASMLDKMIENSQNHVASLQKAAAACAGRSAPTAQQYDEVVSEV